MIYSVFQYGTKSYDYYDDGKPSPTHAGTPSSLGASDSIGQSVESAAWRVPGGAKKVGSGVIPRGRIASLGGISDGGDLVKMGLVVAAAYFAWRHFR